MLILKKCELSEFDKSIEKAMTQVSYYCSFILLGFVIIALNSLIVCKIYAQQSSNQEIKREAEQRLRQMTPEEIDAKIREYGLTREQAEAKAKELGIDLETYLRTRSASLPQVQPKTEAVKVEVKPPATSDTTKQEIPVEIKPAEPTVPPKIPIPTQFGPGELPYYGYNIFKAGPSAFEPRTLIDDQYIIGENDILSISLWGEFQSYNEYKVDKEGRILISTVGPIYVAGYTVEKAKNIVLNAMSKAYSGLKKSPPSIFMDLSVARIRPLRIFIMGEVANPGGYAVSPIANVFNSLFSAGGPNISGSLREVRVIRNNKVITKVDVYDYLIGTQKTNDVRMNDNDIIYVPLRGRTVGIKGAVLRSAYFELSSNENLKRLLELAGGIRSNFYLQRVQVDRIIPFAERKKGELDRKIFDINFADVLLDGKDLELIDGDIITIFPILDEKKNFVSIEGAVWRPGAFQLEKISTLKDLIKAADGLRPEAYYEHAQIVRTYDNKRTEVFFVNLSRAMEGEPTNNIILEPRDNIRVFSIYEMLTGHESITVEGIAKRPGTYALHKNLTLFDIVYDAVGLTDTLFREKIYLQRADLIRLNEDRSTSRIVPFNLWDLFESRKNDTLLLPGDRIVIYPITAIEFKDRYVDISGKVKSPGRYKLSENATLFDILMQAGGYTEDAWSVYAEVDRLERTGIGKDSLSRVILSQVPDLFDTSKVNPDSVASYRESSLRLQHRDQIYIRPNPNYIFQKIVTVEGEVEHSGTYVLSKLEERLSDVIQRAGGIKKSGHSEGGKIIRKDTRMRIDVADALDDPEGDNDIILQSGDLISIPLRPFSVQISGEVNNPGLFSFVNGKKLSFYIEESGGVTDSADFALVTFPTGLIEKYGLQWWSGNPKIPDGSSIFVVKEKPKPPEPPEKQGEKVTMYDVVKDMTAILVSALTIVVLAKQVQ